MRELVVLSVQEMYQSGLVGYRRNLESIVRGRKPRFDERFSGELFGFHIIAAMAEMAVAKYLNRFWGFHMNRFECGDVGDYEVRYSQRNDMKVREKDAGYVISVSGEPPRFVINGYMLAEEARKLVKPTAPRKGPEAYFVPHEKLLPINDLKNRKL